MCSLKYGKRRNFTLFLEKHIMYKLTQVYNTNYGGGVHMDTFSTFILERLSWEYMYIP